MGTGTPGALRFLSSPAGGAEGFFLLSFEGGDLPFAGRASEAAGRGKPSEEEEGAAFIFAELWAEEAASCPFTGLLTGEGAGACPFLAGGFFLRGFFGVGMGRSIKKQPHPVKVF